MGVYLIQRAKCNGFAPWFWEPVEGFDSHIFCYPVFLLKQQSFYVIREKKSEKPLWFHLFFLPLYRPSRKPKSTDKGEGRGCIFMERRLQSACSLAIQNFANSDFNQEQRNSRRPVGMFYTPIPYLYIRIRFSIYIFGVGLWCCSFSWSGQCEGLVQRDEWQSTDSHAFFILMAS